MHSERPEPFPFADQVGERRRRLSLSQREVARRMNDAAEREGTHCGATHQTVHEYEAAGSDGWPRIPRPDTLRWLAVALELPLGQLVAAAARQRDYRHQARGQEAGSAAALLGFPRSLGEAITLTLALWGEDVRRRDFLVGAPFAAAAAIVPG
jgi:transcriptional regulator with XRE-family HTH domain